MAKNYADIAKSVLLHMGGESNVTHFEHCSTRLRFSIADPAKVDREKLKAIPGVMGVVGSGAQCQVVIGNDVIEVYDEMNKIAKFTGGSASQSPAAKQGIGSIVLDFMVGVFQPLVPAIAGGGILKAMLALFTMLGVMDNASVLYKVLLNVADAPLYFLPILVAVTMSTKLNCNRLVAVSTVGALILPATTALITAKEAPVLFGVTLQNVNYAYQVFPAILAVAVLYYVEKLITKITPKAIRVFFVPMVCFGVVFPLTLMFLGPAGLFLGQILTAGMLSIYKYVGWLGVGVVAAVLPLLISLGAHKAFIPYAVSSYSELGYEILYLGASLAHNISEGGASLAVAFKTKNHDLRSAAISGGVSAIFGITEPAIYSVTLQHKKVLWSVMIGSFVSGAFLGLMAVKAFVIMGPGLAGMAMYIDPENSMNIVWAFVGFGIALSVSFFATLFLYHDEAPAETIPSIVPPSGAVPPIVPPTLGGKQGGNSSLGGKPASVGKPLAEGDNYVKPGSMVSPLDGTVVMLSDVKDEVFSTGVLGKGAAVLPTKGELYSPVDGTVTMIPETKHAAAVKDPSGAEILMHIGMDTVELNGKFYEPQVKAGDKVKKGQLLIKFDLEEIRRAGYDLTTPIVITNSDNIGVKTLAQGEITAGTELLRWE